jgi:hypothetical protein
MRILSKSCIFAAFAAMIYFFGCSSTPQKRNAELVVTYNGKEVHRASPIYKNRIEFNRYVLGSGKKYIIFGADWCKRCKFMYKAIKQTEHFEKIAIINVDRPWVAKLFATTGLNAVPVMVVLDENNNLSEVELGASKIVMNLLINIE